MKEKILNFITSQLNDIDRKIRDLEYEDYDHDNIHRAIDFFAEDEENAMVGYIEVVADIEEEEKSLHPNVISIEEALKRYGEAAIEGCETEKEKIRDFHKQISSFEKYVSKSIEPYIVFLVDGSLV